MSDQPPDAPPGEPTFGLIDVIEAFTAMRHEFRTQSTEDRKLADQLARATEQIDQLETKIQRSMDKLPQNMAAMSRPSADLASADVRRLCETLAEIDHHLSRTIQIAVRSLSQGDSIDGLQDRAVEHFKQQIDVRLNRTGWLRRWFVRSWARELQQSVESLPKSTSATNSATVSALRMLHQRAARLIHDAGVERMDVTGKLFDGSLMNAVESVASNDYPSGHVAYQISPAYRWRDTIVRYAEVNVSSG